MFDCDTRPTLDSTGSVVVKYNYDPEIGRFMTIDDLSHLDSESINGLNLYAYCGNNPVSRVDPIGTAWYDILAWIGVGLFVAAAVAMNPVILFHAGFVSELSIFATYELPILTQRGIDVIRTIVGG